MPRVKTDDLKLLHKVHGRLCFHRELETAQQLGILLDRLEVEQEREREANRKRATQNRQAGYVWGSSNRPKKSKYYEREDSENESGG